MKGKVCLYFFLLLGFYFRANCCAAQVMFQKTYGRDSTDFITALVKTNDGGYLIAGNSRDYDRGNVYIILVKTNSDGDTLWTKIYGDTLGDYSLVSIQKTTDGGFIFIGSVMNFISGNGGVYLLKTDANFNSLWTKTYTGTTAMEAFSVQQTNDGGYIFSGYGSYNAHACISVIRTNNLGDTLWTRAYADSSNLNLYGFDILSNTDGSFVLTAGLTGSGSLIIKIDMNGNLMWNRLYHDMSAYSFQHTNDGGYVIGGIMSRAGFPDDDFAVIKTNANGDTLWTRTYGTGSDDFGRSIQQTNDGGYIFIGGVASFTYSDFHLCKIDSVGNVLWDKEYGGIYDDYGSLVLQAADGGYVFAGVTYSFGAMTEDFYLIKTNSSGMSGCYESTTPFTMSFTNMIIISAGIFAIPSHVNVSSITIPVSNPPIQQTTLCYTVGIEEMNATENDVIIFPNPATDEFKVESSKFNVKDIEVYGPLGNKVYESTFTKSINVSNWSSGIYFVRLKSNDEVKSVKVLVQH